MATAIESTIGRRANANTRERQWKIKGAATEADALTALLAAAPTSLDGQDRIDKDCEVEEFIEGNMWTGIVKYASSDLVQFQPVNSFHISFDISGVNTHITQTRNTVAKYPSGYGRDFKGAIGVNQDGTVEGVDIVVPALTFTINYTFAEAGVDDSYIATLLNAVGSVNTDSFHEFAAGTLLLTSVSGQQRDDKKWDVSFKFASSPNVTGLAVGDITGIAKKGWEYMWVYYESKSYTTGGIPFVNKVPVQVYIEEVYRKTAYSALGI